MKFNDLVQVICENKLDTIAIVAGSFKPPHQGHYEMIKAYSKKADKVIVMVSDPKKNVRTDANGNIISQKTAINILKIFTKGLKNVEIIPSIDPSPVKSLYDYIGEISVPTNIILGVSKKGGDFKRYLSVGKYFEKKGSPVIILDPKENAVDVKSNISATELRENINNKEYIKSKMPKMSDKDFEKVYSMLV